jgi:hypothetical protein
LPIYLREILNSLNIQLPKKETPKVIAQTESTRIIEHRLKSEFPKIEFKSLPDNLKKLVYVRYDCWTKSIKNHALQHNCDNDIDRFHAAKSCVLSIIENWQIWSELNHYQKHNELLGAYPSSKENEFQEKIKSLELLSSEVRTKELMVIRRRARNNIHTLVRKEKLNARQNAILEDWIEKHDFVSEKLGEPKWK